MSKALDIVCRAGTVDAGNLPADRLEGIVPQPFQPYNFSDPVNPVILSKKDAA